MPAKAKAKTPKNTTKKKATEALFESFGLPGWLGWGTAGAESTYGTNGEFAFGGIDLPNSGGQNYWIEARESAKAYKRLVGEYGSVEAAIPHYSGNSYTISHVKQLAVGGGQGGTVDASFLGDLGNLGSELLGGGLLEQGSAGKALGGSAATDEAVGGAVSGGLLAPIVEPIANIGATFKVVGELLFTPEGWLRIGKLLGGALFFVWGVERLIQGAAPAGVKQGSGLLKDAAIAAVVK